VSVVIKRVILVLSFFSLSIELYGLDLVDRYLEERDIERAIDRLFFLARDERNFISNNLGESITPQEIYERVEKTKTLSSNPDEKRAIDSFFEQDEVKRNLFIASYLLLREKRYFEAINRCEEILKDYPTNRYALLCRAEASLNTTDHSQAEDSYRKLIVLYPKEVKYRYKLIDIYLEDKKVQKAKSLFNETSKLFPKDKSLSKYREKIEDAESFWASLFGYDNEDETVEDSEDSEGSENSETKDRNISTGFSTIFELNRVQDYSILNIKRDSSLVEENIYGIDEILPQDHSTLFARPNIDVSYKMGVSQYLVGVKLNYFYKYYISGSNINYGVISPALLFIDPKRDYSIDLTFSQISADGNSISNYGFGLSWRLFDIDFRTTYKLNSFSDSDLDRDTLSLSIGKGFKLSNSELRVQYLLILNSFLQESKISYIPKSEIEDSNLSTLQVSTIYPSSYTSHKISINYLMSFWQSLFWESGIDIEYRDFKIDRSDTTMAIFTILEYKLNNRNSFAGYLKRVDNFSSEDGQDFYENIIGISYIFQL